MAANNETRILKSNSIEELRQKTNEISFGLGDKKLLDSNLQDKIFTHTSAAGDYLVAPTNTRFELKPEETVDNTAGYILLTGSPTIPGGFAAGAALTQSGGYSATIVSASSTKILVKNSSGTFDSTAQITAGSDNIAGSAIRSLVAESYKKGEVRVKVGSTEFTQDATEVNGFHVPNHAGSITITGISNAADVSDFEEGATIFQGTNLGSATFTATVLDCSTSLLRIKSFTGSLNASTVIKVSGASDTIPGANHGALVQTDLTFGAIIEFNTPRSSGDAVQIISTNLVDAINEVQDDVGTIGSLAAGISDRSDLVTATNSLKTEIGTASLDTSATSLRGAVNELHTEINSNDTDIATINTKLGTITSGAMGTSASTVSTAIAELHTDVDARVKLTSGSTQTINGNVNFTNGKTFTFPSGSTLDIRQGSLLTGSGGGELTFDTAFLTLTVNDTSNSAVNQFGLEGRRAGSGADVRVQWNETLVSSKPDRAWQVQGLADDGTTSTTADIVTFYNAQDLVANNTETGIDVTWDSTNQNFDFALSADPTITLAGDLGGTATLTNLTDATLTATIQAGSVENSMIAAGTIANDKLAGSIANAKLANPSITVSDGSNTSPVALGSTLTFSGTSGEVEVSESGGTVTVGLPNNVTVGGNLTITGNLDVNGTQTTINTSTLEIDDTLILMGASNTEPSTGGFGLETRAFTGTTAPHANAAAGVTGTHSIVYNFATDRWEADGSLILSEATLGVPTVAVDSGSNIDLSSSRRLHFTDGSGINITGALNSSDIDINIINTDKGSDQTFYRTFTTDSGSNVVASANNDIIEIEGGTGLTTTGSTDKISIKLDDTAVTAASYGSQFIVPRITVDAQGRLTGVTNQTAISLSALGYTGATDANNYSFNISGDSGSANAITNGETFDIEGKGSTATGGNGEAASANNVETVVSGNKVTIKTVDTRYTVTDGQLSQKNFTTTLKNKLDGISASANNYSFVVGDHNNNQSTITNGEVFRILQAGATTVTRNADNQITISSTDTQYSAATTGAAGLMSAADKSKLNGIAANATNTAAPHYTSAIVSSDVTTALGFTPYSNANPSNFTSNAGTLTGITAGGGISVSGSGATRTVALSGSYSGTWAVSGAITATGNITAFVSDMRLKDRKSDISNALEKVESLSGFNYKLNDAGIKLMGDTYLDEEHVGVSAQEVEKVLPEAVKPAPINSEYKTVQYERLVPLLIEAIKELSEEIKELKMHK